MHHFNDQTLDDFWQQSISDVGDLFESTLVLPSYMERREWRTVRRDALYRLREFIVDTIEQFDLMFSAMQTEDNSYEYESRYGESFETVVSDEIMANALISLNRIDLFGVDLKNRRASAVSEASNSVRNEDKPPSLFDGGEIRQEIIDDKRVSEETYNKLVNQFKAEDTCSSITVGDVSINQTHVNSAIVDIINGNGEPAAPDKICDYLITKPVGKSNNTITVCVLVRRQELIKGKVSTFLDYFPAIEKVKIRTTVRNSIKNWILDANMSDIYKSAIPVVFMKDNVCYGPWGRGVYSLLEAG